jgi:hypothetical protein
MSDLYAVFDHPAIAVGGGFRKYNPFCNQSTMSTKIQFVCAQSSDDANASAVYT